MFTNFVAMVMTVVMMWGYVENPVVSTQTCRLSDPYNNGKIIREWRNEYHFNGQVDTIEIEP